jgi:hypothetical protein
MAGENTYRFVICVDVCLGDEEGKPEEQAEDLKKAYAYLYKLMGQVEVNSLQQVQWESSDEAYAPDGQAILEEALQAARMAVIEEQNP